MNGYELMAVSYKKLLNETDLTDEEKNTMKKEIRMCEFLATCDDEDKKILFNSSAFNDYIKDYLVRAIDNADIENKKETKEKVLLELKNIMD